MLEEELSTWPRIVPPFPGIGYVPEEIQSAIVSQRSNIVVYRPIVTSVRILKHIPLREIIQYTRTDADVTIPNGFLTDRA